MSNQKNLLLRNNAITYLMTSLSRKGVKVVDFCKITHISQSFISYMKNDRFHYRIPDAVWDFICEMYEKKSFEEVMSGGGPKLRKMKRGPKVYKESFGNMDAVKNLLDEGFVIEEITVKFKKGGVK